MWPFSSRKPRSAAHSQSSRNSFQPRLEALEDRCLLSGGVLDPTFGKGGLVNTPVVPGNLISPRAVATYPQTGSANDGKIVLASNAYDTAGAYAIDRYNLNGTLDSTFGSKGQVTTNLGGVANAVAVQPDGKVLAAGTTDLVRYNAAGTLDTTFGKKGEVALPFAAQSMVLQPDGKIVVVGPPSSNDLTLTRYNANGSLDTTFGAGGTAALPFTSPFASPTAVIDPGTSPQDPNAGKLVVAGMFNGKATVVRFNTNGSPDTTFGTGGISSTTLANAGPPALAIQADGRIVVVDTVTANRAFGLFRLNPNGTPDMTFGSGGFVDPALQSSGGVDAESVTIQGDGNILAAGINPVTKNVLVAHYNAANGSLDTSFGNGGVAAAQVGTTAGWAPLALEPDGRIVVAGTGGISGIGITTFVARFLAAGPQIGSFTASPNPVPAGSTGTLTAASVVALNPGTTVAQVAFYVDSNADGSLEAGTDRLVGYATQTSPGTWVLTLSTTGWTAGSYVLFAQARDSDGALSDPLAVTLQLT